MSLSAGGATVPPTPDPCAWVKGIGSVNALVWGSTAFRQAREDGTILDTPRDVLTPRTAGRIAAHDQAVMEFCDAGP